MRKAVLVGLILLVCVGLTGCSGGGVGGGGGTLPTAQVSVVFDRYGQGVVAGDSEQVASCFATSFEIVMPDGTYQATREMYKQAWDIILSVVDYTRYDFTGLQITFQGTDEAEVTGTIVAQVRLLATGETADATMVGRWTLRQFDGQWLIVREEEQPL